MERCIRLGLGQLLLEVIEKAGAVGGLAVYIILGGINTGKQSIRLALSFVLFRGFETASENIHSNTKLLWPPNNDPERWMSIEE